MIALDTFLQNFHFVFFTGNEGGAGCHNEQSAQVNDVLVHDYASMVVVRNHI